MIRRYVLSLNRKTDADLITRIEAEPNMQGYIKALIRADLAKDRNE